jgi:hypothetical protein
LYKKLLYGREDYMIAVESHYGRALGIQARYFCNPRETRGRRSGQGLRVVNILKPAEKTGVEQIDVTQYASQGVHQFLGVDY